MSDTDDTGLMSRSRELLCRMKTRRSVRSFQTAQIPQDVIRNCIAIAASAPSGANTQPWSFILVAHPQMKKAIRQKAEEIERIFYSKKITSNWKKKLEPLETNADKPFLEHAPYLICIFVQKYGYDPKGKRCPHYYPFESVGIATGFLIYSLHLLGIASLPYTPAPMTFLLEFLGRPKNEKPYMILAVGYPDRNFIPPSLEKKKEEEYLEIL